MDPRRFDGMIRKLSGSLSRRSLVGGSLGASVLAAVGLSADEAHAKKKKVEAEACIPTGKKCPSKKPRGRTGKNKKPKKLSCNQCCQRRVTQNAKGQNICYCAPQGEACTETRECCDGRCTGGTCQLQQHAPPPVIPDVLPAQCNLPLEREDATQGGGTAGTNQCPTAAGCVQTIQVNLQGALPNQGYDVYIDQESGGGLADHIFAGTFTTDAAGNAIFQNTITVPGACPSVVDNEIVLQGASPFEHQFIQQSFVPCAFCA